MNDAVPSFALEALRRNLGVEDADRCLTGLDDTTRLACWMIAATRPWPDTTRNVMQALMVAHSEGEQDAVQWRRLRGAAVALGDNEEVEIRAYGRVAEAAAWPLDSSQAGLVDIMQAVCLLRAEQVSRVTGWTQADEAMAQAVLTRIATGDGTIRPPREDIPARFRAADPMLERRFSAHTNAANAAFEGFRAEVVAWLAGATR